FSSRRRHTRFSRDWSSDVCSSDLEERGDSVTTRKSIHPQRAWGDMNLWFKEHSSLFPAPCSLFPVHFFLQFLKPSRLFILPHIIPEEITSVHGDVDAGWKTLHKGECAAEVEESVGATKFDGYHGAGQHNGLARDFS